MSHRQVRGPTKACYLWRVGILGGEGKGCGASL